MAQETKNTADVALDIMSQMSRVTLDIIGSAGIGKDFNTIEKDDDPLARLYATITTPDRGNLLVYFLVQMFVPHWITRRLKGTIYARIYNAQEELRRHIRALLREKKQILREKPEQQKDIIAIIMRSG